MKPTRWNKFYEKQMEDPKMRKLVERELDHLKPGVKSSKLRAAEKKRFVALADRLVTARGSEKGKLKKELAKLTFGK